jgi:hypothetical protein
MAMKHGGRGPGHLSRWTAAVSPIPYLFANGEQGAWFDFTDTSTWYQDAARTTPAATLGDVVGGIADKSGRGNHASQASGTQKPLRARIPLGGRRNMLVATATMGTQSVTVPAAQLTLSIMGTGTVTLTGVSTAGPLIGTGAGNTVSLTFTPTAGSLTLTVVGSVTSAQLELGAARTGYQAVVADWDVTESGVTSIPALYFDGSDDSLATAAIDFTGTDKMTVFAGVEKLSDAAIGMVMELSPTVNSNNGSFWLAAPIGAGVANYDFSSKGTTGQSKNRSGFTAPHTAVLTAQADIAAPSITLSVNGSTASATTTTQGTGNYGNYALFIGRRNSASLPFKGYMIGHMVIVGKLANASEIAAVEATERAATGAY